MSVPSDRPDMQKRVASLVGEADRRGIVSSVRLSVALMVMVTLIVLALTALIFGIVSRVFGAMTPLAKSDLEWKAVRGAFELSKTAELGLAMGDPQQIRAVVQPYIEAPDVVNVLAENADGKQIFQFGSRSAQVAPVFARAPDKVHRLGDRLVAWSEARIEGTQVGRIAVAVSTARLEAGDELRAQISQAAVAGGLIAVLLALGFVVLYILPVLRVTRAAFSHLEQTTEMAVAGARMKAQFLANMSHEIRTPMNAVIGLSKLMLGMRLDDKVRRYAERIDASSRALLSIINDVLDFSKLEAGKYEIYRSPCELSLTIQEVAELLAERAQSKGIELVCRIAPEVPRIVEADAERLRQVLTNLVGNAVKFTEQGEVFIQLVSKPVEGDQVEVRLEVYDTGPGIPVDKQREIFESFSQADGSLVRQHGGTGLGLAISKQLVELMGGSLSVESEPGKGSCFTVTLQLKVVDERPSIRTPASSLGKQVLIVCDNARASNAIEEHVRAWGMGAVLARDARQAGERLRASQRAGGALDVVVISETRSGAARGDVVAAIRREGAENALPIVVLSQLDGGRAESEADQGIVAQLAQPVRMSELYECLNRVLVPGQALAPEVRDGAQLQSFKGAHVLVVDDNEMNQFVAVEHLKRFDCQVSQAYNGKEAVEAVLANQFALVLMDCQMPVMDGYTATREIRAREGEGRRTVIVALTAHALTGERERVLAAQMDDYLTKPVRPQTLQRTLARWIRLDAGEPASALDGVELPHSERRQSEQARLDDCATALLELLLDKVPAQLELLDAAMAMEDLLEARAQAHKLKGSLLAVSASELANLAEALQHDAEHGDLSHGEATFKELLAGFGVLEQRVRRELARRARASKGVAHG